MTDSRYQVMLKCPQCSFEQSDQALECVKCGIIFKKYQKIKKLRSVSDDGLEENKIGFQAFVRSLIFYVKPETDPLIFGSRVVFFLVFFIWGLKFIFTPMETNMVGESVWHLVNLPFHEAGHVLFRPFGRFITSLGGSLLQLLIPLICMITFLIKTRDAFAASFSLWWTGENFMDLAPYINDARALKLPLLGGNTGRTSPYGFHDWEFILRESGLIKYHGIIANASYRLGSVLMVMAFMWGGYVLFKQYKNISKS